MALDANSLGGPLGLEIGPPLSSRQRKAAAAFVIGHILGLADLRGSACRRRGERKIKHSAGRPAATGASKGLASIAQLRQSAVKRRAEDEADAAFAAACKRAACAESRPRAAAVAAEVSIVGRKPIAIVPPGGSAIPANSSPLGCHLARRCCGGSGRGAAAGGPAGGAMGGSLAQVYGSRLRVGLLPDDYSECFAGLDPEPEQDGMEGQAAQFAGGLQQHATGVAADPNAAPFTGGALLGSTSVGASLPFPFTAPLGAGAAEQAAGQEGGMAPGGGLHAPFLHADSAFAGLPYDGGLPYGNLVENAAAATGATAPAPNAATDLMLDPDEGMSSDSDGEGRQGGGLCDAGLMAPLGPAAGMLGPGNPGFPQPGAGQAFPQPGAGQVYPSGLYGGAEHGLGQVGMGVGLMGHVAGAVAVGGQEGFGVDGSGTEGGLEDDGAMVEEF